MRVRSLVGTLSVAAVGLAGMACSGGDDTGPGGAVAEGDLATIAASLDALPRSGSHETIVWGDFVRAAAIAGIDRPRDARNQPAVSEYLLTLTSGRVGDDGTGPGGGPPVVLRPPTPAHVGRPVRLEDFTADVGWNILQVDRFVERQTAPDDVTVLEGDFDADQITDALGDGDDGQWTAGDPDADDFAVNVEDMTPARPIGESLHLSLDGDHLAVTRSADSAAATRAALAGTSDEATLGEDTTLVGLAEALDAERPYAAILVSPGLNADFANTFGDSAPTVDPRTDPCAGTLPRMPAALATAVTDDDGPVVLLAFAHHSAGDARANAGALRDIVEHGRSAATDRSWRELVTLDDVRTTGDDGTVVVARLRPTGDTAPSLWTGLLEQRDSLVTAC